MAKRDFYEILGVSKSATPEEIRRAHRTLVRKYHPDVNKDNAAATEKFKEVQEAYDVLSDDSKRAQYDQFGHAGPQPFGGGGGGGGSGGDPFEAFRRAQAGARGGGRRSGSVNVEDFDYNTAAGMNGGDFSQIFEQMFGGGGRRGRGRQAAPSPQRGNDIEHTVTLTFEQAARGTSLPLQISRGGQLETIDVKLPAGVKDGSKVRLRGKGEQTGGEPGDLYIITKVQPHAYFRRNGLDILMDVPVSLYEALLGTKVEVPTLEGKVTITIPPGTNSGSKLRIKGRGIQRKDEQGDQYAVVKIIVAKNLNEEERDLVDALQAKQPIEARKDVQW